MLRGQGTLKQMLGVSTFSKKKSNQSSKEDDTKDESPLSLNGSSRKRPLDHPQPGGERRGSRTYRSCSQPAQVSNANRYINSHPSAKQQGRPSAH